MTRRLLLSTLVACAGTLSAAPTLVHDGSVSTDSRGRLVIKGGHLSVEGGPLRITQGAILKDDFTLFDTNNLVFVGPVTLPDKGSPVNIEVDDAGNYVRFPGAVTGRTGLEVTGRGYVTLETNNNLGGKLIVTGNDVRLLANGAARGATVLHAVEGGDFHLDNDAALDRVPDNVPVLLDNGFISLWGGVSGVRETLGPLTARGTNCTLYFSGPPGRLWFTGLAKNGLPSDAWLLIEDWNGNVKGNGQHVVGIGDKKHKLSKKELERIVFFTPVAGNGDDYRAQQLSTGELVPDFDRPVSQQTAGNTGGTTYGGVLMISAGSSWSPVKIVPLESNLVIQPATPLVIPSTGLASGHQPLLLTNTYAPLTLPYGTIIGTHLSGHATLVTNGVSLFVPGTPAP